MKIKIKIDGDQRDEIVAAAIKDSYDSVAGATNYGTPEEYLAMVSAFQLVYQYYTGKTLE